MSEGTKGDDLFAERDKRGSRHLETGDTEWDADDRDAQEDVRQEVAEGEASSQR